MRTQRQRDAAKQGVKLSDDVSQGGGYTKDTHTKRDWHKCPRCQGRISRDLRRCLNCKGAVLFPGDDGAKYNREMTYWFMWHKNVWGVEGYYAKDYWDAGCHTSKY